MDPKDPMDMEIRTYLDSLHGIVTDSGGSTNSSLAPGGSCGADSEDEADAESHNPEDEDENEEGRNKGSKQVSGRKRRRPRGRPRNSNTHGNSSASHAASLVGSEYGCAGIGRLSLRKHARFEEELAAVATTMIRGASGEVQQTSAEPAEGTRRGSRRGVVYLQNSTAQSGTKLPPGTFYVHKQFQESCRLSRNQHEDEINRLEEAAMALSVRVDEHRASKTSALLDGMQSLRPPPICMDPNWSVVDIQMATQAVGEIGRDYAQIAARLVNKTPSMVATLFELYGQHLNFSELAAMAPLTGR
ncbi:unnamed protein product [Echinostoma caproni]|uniref:SANT domain-containing protein n=1 Tax=Echinostoma caproni TaxID=27848 RepID=A0A3P8KMS5_9TREM|nr:unnamed protein product [Echinostoma caproni]